MLAAGLEGIEKKYKAPAPVEDNVYEMSEDERKKRGIDSLPGSLIEALQYTEQSQIVRKALGDHVFDHFVENKKMEWDKFRVQISSYELSEYLPIL